ncbi:hypothetical protein PsorP6_004822 [Peronosclerospora sorghi]|uniref:Uncharacterized protein n=1 Tax=Peronosclerospora sorghi TaxID=230839 RepID=A0ACC0VM11_9STRA|nr:hypothetical protein PsorP6_004822 [Peronosclerospora sorghi]
MALMRIRDPWCIQQKERYDAKMRGKVGFIAATGHLQPGLFNGPLDVGPPISAISGLVSNDDITVYARRHLNTLISRSRTLVPIQVGDH